MISRFAPVAVVLASLSTVPAGAQELNRREHPDPATAARMAERSAIAQRLSKQNLFILGPGVIACANGDIVVFNGVAKQLRTIAPGSAVVVTPCR